MEKILYPVLRLDQPSLLEVHSLTNIMSLFNLPVIMKQDSGLRRFIVHMPLIDALTHVQPFISNVKQYVFDLSST